MKIQTKTVCFFMCPACNKHELNIDWYLENKRYEAHSDCECGKKIHWAISDGEIAIKNIIDGNENVLDILSYCHDKRLKLLVKGKMYRHDGKLQDFDGRKYWYNEHTCPTNWTRDIVKVILDRDTDPHGVFELETTIMMPDAHSAQSIEVVENEINGCASGQFTKIDDKST